MPRIFTLGVFFLLGFAALSGCSQKQETSGSQQANLNNSAPGNAKANETAVQGPGNGEPASGITPAAQATNNGQPTSSPAPALDSGNAPETIAVKEFNIIARTWDFEPATITVNKGDKVKLNITSEDVKHGIALPDFGVSNKEIEPGKTVSVEFTTDKAGEFTFFCNVFCGDGHKDMKGKLIVK